MKRALLVIDVQNEYFSGGLPVSHPAGSFANILAAMDAAHRAGVPVAVIRHGSAAPNAPLFRKGGHEWELHAEIAKRPCDILIDKEWPDSFQGTGLRDWLTEVGANTLCIAGYMTQMCCQTTASRAWHLGYQVEFIADATGTLDRPGFAGPVSADELYRSVLATLARFTHVVSTADWLKRIA
ncbi:MAG: cysteine hydrolase [Gammaproteobacteria bacterium]|nr:cysteine hydrolase [Gammaproteobacteria bacterium]MBU1416217.1 cysteine hydrolase [Gammaproteobacteria bacterium]